MSQTPLGDLTALFRSRRFSGGYTSKKREEKGRKEQGEEGCTVQGRIRHCYGNTVLQRSTHNYAGPQASQQLNPPLLLFGLSQDLDRTLRQRKAQRKAKSKVIKVTKCNFVIFLFCHPELSSVNLWYLAD